MGEHTIYVSLTKKLKNLDGGRHGGAYLPQGGVSGALFYKIPDKTK